MDDLLMLGDTLVLSQLRRDARRPFAEDFSGREWEPIETGAPSLGNALLAGLTWLARCVVTPLRQARTPEGAAALVSESRPATTAAPATAQSPSQRLAA
jgi:hypothetical protein